MLSWLVTLCSGFLCELCLTATSNAAWLPHCIVLVSHRCCGAAGAGPGLSLVCG